MYADWMNKFDLKLSREEIKEYFKNKKKKNKLKRQAKKNREISL